MTIVAHKLRKSFGSVAAVKDVSFEVAPGEIYGLLGPNGAGKTTCMRMLATLIRPDSGSASIGGFDCQTDPFAVRAILGYDTGDTRLYERLTPVEFLRYFGTLHDMDKAQLKDRVATLVEQLEIGEFADRPCVTLSTGQQQRVSLARALLHEPQAIVLDEPTNGLDIVSSRFVLEALKREREAGRSIIVSTHIMAEAELLSDRIGVVHRGELIAEGTLDVLCEQTEESSLAGAFLKLIESREKEGTS